MFKTLAFQPENGFFVGDLPDSCGAPRILDYRLKTTDLRLLIPQFNILHSQFSIVVLIIPNSAGMFNEKITFFKKNEHRFHRFLRISTDFLTTKNAKGTKKYLIADTWGINTYGINYADSHRFKRHKK